MARGFYRRASATSFDAEELFRLLNELAGPLARVAALVSSNARAAGSAVPERLSETWGDLSTSVRDNARFVGAEASRTGRHVWHRVEDEVAHRPLVALAIAAGIGFLIGALNSRR
jgi:ElaB/YqjD/DUF883 family membrane-anchored ribosome-binding protein